MKIARERRGISQRGLGRNIGVGSKQINRYENGLTVPTAVILARIAEELGVTSDYLIGLSDMLERFPAGELPPEESRLLEAFTVGDAKTVVKLLTDRIRRLEGEEE